MTTFGVGVSAHNPNKSIEVVQPPTDGISSLAFSPNRNLLVAGSWDNQVRCWEIQQQQQYGAVSLQSIPKAVSSHTQPVLAVCWNHDGSTVFSGGCDRQAKMWPVATGGAATTVAQHDQPISALSWVPEMNCLVTCSWDKTLKYWDTRQSTPACTVQLPDKGYCMSVRHPLLVVGTADRNLLVYNLTNPQVEYKRIQSPLKYMTRCVATFPDKTGYLVGSIEGRVAVQHVDDSLSSKNFTFKCHRDNNDIYSVNSLSFHPTHGTFATTGSDGAYNFWDKDSKQRLKAFNRCNAPIPASCFNHDGSIFAYAVSYDWSKGAEAYNPNTPNQNHILLHITQEVDVKARPRTANTSTRR
eukprot:jgi/Mesvir1/5215/Mv15345-RA.1